MKLGVHQIVLASLMLPAVAQQPQPKPAARTMETAKARVAALKPGQVLGDKAAVVDLDGKPHKVKDLLGKITVINFHSAVATSQRAADEKLLALQKAHEKDGVVFLHINSNANEVGMRVQKASTQADAPKPYARLRSYLKLHKLPFRMFVDHHNRVADALGAKTTPHVFVFAEGGKLIYRGCLQYNEHQFLRDTLNQLVAGKAVKPFERPSSGSEVSRVKPLTTSQYHITAKDDIVLARETAKRKNKLLLYNFTGFNCANCRIMEESVFLEDAVRELMRQHVVEARLHVDTLNNLTAKQFAANRKLQAKLGNVLANPYYVVVDPTNNEILGTFLLSGSFKTWPGNWTKFLEAMAKKAGRPTK